MARGSPFVAASVSLLLWTLVLSAATPAHASSCEVEGYDPTWSTDYCCLPGYFFEQAPPNRTFSGPRCTRCGLFFYACADAGCCGVDQFCFTNDAGSALCSSVELVNDTAPFPAGVVISSRVGTAPHFDRQPTPTASPVSGWSVWRVLGLVSFILAVVLCVAQACAWGVVHPIREQREYKRKMQLELEAGLEAAVPARRNAAAPSNNARAAGPASASNSLVQALLQPHDGQQSENHSPVGSVSGSSASGAYLPPVLQRPPSPSFSYQPPLASLAPARPIVSFSHAVAMPEQDEDDGAQDRPWVGTIEQSELVLSVQL